MMDNNLRDPGRPPQALSPNSQNSQNGNSPARNTDDEYEYPMNNLSLLKAQLKLVTHERDMLKKDVKKITMERDGALKHLSLTTGNVSMMDFVSGHHHHRTASDTASSSTKPGQSSTLSRSHSIASAGDKSLILSTSAASNSPPLMHHQSLRHELTSEQRLLHELQITKKQHGDALKKCEQTMKDAEFYHAEAESIRTRYNDLLIEKQRCEQEVSSLRMFMEDERKELSELRKEAILSNSENGSEPLSLMYSQLLQNYENVKDDYSLVRKRYDDLVASHSAAVSKLEHSQEEIGRYKTLYNEVLMERNQFKQQCTQAIRQWDQTLREKNEYKEALAKVKRQHDDAIKEINQAMTVRIKASKDIKRLTEERNAAMQEYSLIMSERDSVHKEIEKLQEEIKEKNKKLTTQEGRHKHHEEEKRKLSCKIEMLKRELEQSMHERDKAMRESHELREKIGGSGKTSSDHDHSKNVNKHRFGDIDKNKKDRDFASTETIDTSALASKKERLDDLDQANAEIEKLRKLGEKLTGELQEATMEADVAKGRRDWAFSERDKVVLERDSIRTLCDKLRRERDRAVSELAEALRDSDDIKKERNETQKENKDLRERLETVEKSLRMKSLQRGSNSHSHDSAIDSDLAEWETEAVDIDMRGLGSQEDLRLDLAGGRDDLHCPTDKPIYVSSIAKGSFLEGKLKVNDCILRVNNMDCRDLDRTAIIHTLKSATSTISLLVKRRRTGKRYSTTLNLTGGLDHGITLELGAYVAKIMPGSVAAKEGSIAVGDRIVCINDQGLDHLANITDATKLLNSGSILSLTLAKSCNSLSSSGQNLSEKVEKKSISATTSPIKDTIRGSQEMIKKLINKDSKLSSSSSEKVYSVNKNNKESSKKLIDTVKEKFGGKRRSSKEPLEISSDHDVIESDKGPDMAIAELDSVINSYHVTKSNNGKKKRSKERDSFRSGGTWPRTRGGPIIEHGTGTILHPQKMKKERLPLAELLSNLPKYPPEGNAKVPYRSNEVWSRSTRRSRPITTYDMLANYAPSSSAAASAASNVSSGTYRGMASEMASGGPPPSRSSTVSREAADHQLQSKAYLSPSDTSIDESVKSAQAGKDVLEQYLKKSKASSLKSASSGLNVPVVPTTSSISDLVDPSSVVGSPPPPLTLPNHSYFKSDYSHLIRPNNQMGFSPYYSSPKYSTPPLPSSELGSPIPDYNRSYNPHYENPPGPQAPSSQPHSLTSVSPTSGLYYGQRGHSPSPASQSIDHLMGKTARGHGGHYGPIPPYSGYPNYQAYQSSYAQQHYHRGPPQDGATNAETSPPPVYEYLSASRPGKENFSSKFRIPSNTSVASHGSASTADRPFSKCSSPLPIYSVQSILPDGRAEHQRIPRKPHPGETRQIYIEKSTEALGITIKENQAKKGVFINSVSENSLANQVGLQVGDQLLDVCGVNLRACGKEQAALVLQNSGNSITMKVQFNPGEYHSMFTLASEDDRVSDEDDEDDQDSSEESDSDSDVMGSTHRHSIRAANTASLRPAQETSRSGSPTPRNSPRGSARQHGVVAQDHRINSGHSTLTRHQISQVIPSLRATQSPHPPFEPRLVFPMLKKSGDLGVRLVGGNAVGIFIHSVDTDSAAYHVGLRCADQILEYNGIDLRNATAEQAAYELAKPADKVTILVQYNPEKYEVIKDQPGDSYYVRAMFDRLPDPQAGPHQLSFRKDDILFIDNTMYNGVPGQWSAWLVDLDGQRGEWGIVPSKYKVDEELLKRSIDSDSDLGMAAAGGNGNNGASVSTRKTWTATRRSFFKRRKGGRSSSRESSAAKELASFSDMASLNYSDSGALHEVEPTINSYVRVQRLDYMVTRPILIIGPLSDVVTEKLIMENPHKFAKCEPEPMACTQEELEKGLMSNMLIDFRRRGSKFECYTVSAIKEICDRNQHCILSIHMEALERLHHNHLYPIVLLIKFKSVKQIKEIKDPRYSEKISQKDAKNMFESTLSLEADYKPYISETIHAGANLRLMAAQIETTIDQEQNKTLWVPSGTIW